MSAAHPTLRNTNMSGPQSCKYMKEREKPQTTNGTLVGVVHLRPSTAERGLSHSSHLFLKGREWYPS